MSKSPEAFRTISEVADELDLPQHVLRFWETRFAQIRPMKRGGGRRYYRPDDVDLLRGIRILLYGEGYTIRGVQRILKEQGPRFVIAAGRGEVADLSGPAAADDESEEEEIYLAADEVEAPEAPAAPEPRAAQPRPVAASPRPSPRTPPFVIEEQPRPGMVRLPPVAPPPAASRAAPARASLSSDDAERLKATLAELLDCKRLLDQVR